MRVLRTVGVIVWVAVLGACGGATEITVEDLEGTWDATAYVYTNSANTSEQVDIVDVYGASMTLTVAADGTTSSVFDNGQGNSSSDGGQFNAEGMVLTLAGVAYEASVSGDRLTLVYDNAAYDFDDNGSDDLATLRITLDRR